MLLVVICTISLLATSIKSLAQQPTNIPDPAGTIKQGSSTLTKKTPISSPTPSQNVLTLNDTTALLQQTNKETDWITMVVSLLSLLVSSAVAYSSNFRKEHIQLCFGRDIILFPVPKTNLTTSSTTIAGVGFNLPITFYNWSPKGGTIQRIRLVISKQGHDDCYDMTWTTFVKIENSEFQDENLAQPIAIKGLSSVNKVIRFDWITEIGGRQFQVKTGDYELMIYAWTKDTPVPDLGFKSCFTIKDEDDLNFKNIMAQNKSTSIWIPLKANEKPNRFLSRNDVDTFYPKSIVK